jgi:hypothetical protein
MRRLGTEATSSLRAGVLSPNSRYITGTEKRPTCPEGCDENGGRERLRVGRGSVRAAVDALTTGSGGASPYPELSPTAQPPALLNLLASVYPLVQDAPAKDAVKFCGAADTGYFPEVGFEVGCVQPHSIQCDERKGTRA